MSLYISYPDVPAARIGAYPKRNRSSAVPLAPTTHLAVTPQRRDDVCYADFFAAPEAVAVAS